MLEAVEPALYVADDALFAFAPAAVGLIGRPSRARVPDTCVVWCIHGRVDRTTYIRPASRAYTMLCPDDYIYSTYVRLLATSVAKNSVMLKHQRKRGSELSHIYVYRYSIQQVQSQQKKNRFSIVRFDQRRCITALDSENVITSNAKIEVPKSFFGLVVRDYVYSWIGRFDPGLEQL